jgi:hypothetical protein
MGRINIRKLLLGGLVAGVVLAIIDVAMYGAILKAPMAQAWKAVGRPTMSDTQRDLEVPMSIFLDLVAGVLLVWIYASIRPRFGAGPGTALKAGLASWFLASVLSAALAVQGVMPLGVMILTSLVLLIEYPLAVVLGARLYSDDGA